MNNIQSNIEAFNNAVVVAALNKKLDRAANSVVGKHVILDKDSAEAVYNMDDFNPRGEFKGWMVRTTKTRGNVQLAMDVRADGKVVLWAM